MRIALHYQLLTLNKRLKYLLLVLILQVASCSSEYDMESKEFDDYLFQTFQEKIPETRHIYIVVGSFQCKGCVQKTLLKIDERVTGKVQNTCSILSATLEKIPLSLLQKVNLKLDNEFGFEKIGIDIANVTLIRTNHKKIELIKFIPLDEIDDIIDHEFSTIPPFNDR